MGFSSQAGHLILKTQAVQGTFDTTLTTAGVAMYLRSGALGSSRELMIPDAEIGGGRDIPNAYLGASAWSGDYEFYARMDSLAVLLKAALGLAAAPVTATGVTTHVITPSDAAQLPFLSIQERIGAGLECFNYTDCVVNTLHLEADANGYVQGTVGIIASRQLAGISAATPAFDNTPMYVGTNTNVKYNSVTLPAKSFSLDINNNFEDDDFRLGSFFLGDLTPKRREITASFGIREGSSALWRQATYGTPSAVSPGGLVTQSPLEINFASYEEIPGGTPSTPYSLKLEIPKYTLTPYAIAVSGDDVIESDIEGQALRPSPGTPILTATVKTGKATIA